MAISDLTRQSLPGPHNIVRTVLDNGITVLVYENHATQSVVLAGSLATGSIFEPPEKNGLASITAASLMRGSETRTFDAINSALEDIGADLDIDAGVHRTGFFGKALAEDLATIAGILGDVLQQPAFPAAQIERLRGEIITGLKIRQQDTRYRANRAFHEQLYPPNHPYHRSVRGTLDTVPQITIDDIRDFHRRHFGPSGMIVAVVGAVRADEAIDIVRHALERWRNPDQPEAPPLPHVAAPTQTQRRFVPLPGKTQADLVVGTIGPARKDADYYAAMLANSVLGQFGMMGRVGEKVREELGLAYDVGSSINAGHGPGPWSVSAGVNPANVDRALEAIVAELERLVREPVSAEDLENVQSYYIGRLPLQLESNEGIANTLVNIETYGLGLDYLLRYRDTIMRLTREDLLAAAQRYIKPDALVVAVAGPESRPQSAS
ncbi:MAG: pitrilysin family protein [Chloroflexota bacterium]